MLRSINAEAELIPHDVFAAIQYKDPDLFTAVGSVITSFTSIF
ncbi:hypothetical protein [Flavobacterium caseinilyticum]|nr:hypothetical protein [Flavobacterium caseinilyticum]